MSSSEEEQDCYLARRHIERLTETCQNIIEIAIDIDIRIGHQNKIGGYFVVL